MKNVVSLNVAAIQFAGSQNISENINAIERGVKEAASHHTRLLVTQECAVCGYPPREVESIHHINPREQQDALEYLQHLAALYDMYICGTYHLDEAERVKYRDHAISRQACLTPVSQTSLVGMGCRILWTRGQS